jgi:hypothetical protein
MRAVLVRQNNQKDDDRRDAPLSERNRADAYTGILDRSVYQPFVLPVEVAMAVCVQVAWSCGRARGPRVC